jgi:hypothetical protein
MLNESHLYTLQAKKRVDHSDAISGNGILSPECMSTTEGKRKG